MDAQGPRAAPQILVPGILLHFFWWQWMGLLREVRHELFLLLSDSHLFVRAHRLRGGRVVVRMLQDRSGLLQHVRYGETHRGVRHKWTC